MLIITLNKCPDGYLLNLVHSEISVLIIYLSPFINPYTYLLNTKLESNYYS